MTLYRCLLLLVTSLSMAVSGFAADIVLSPESPVLGRILTLSLSVEDATDQEWTIERKDKAGNIEDVEIMEGENGAKIISAVKDGEYFISVVYKHSGAAQKARDHFIVKSFEELQEEKTQKADERLSQSKVTQATVLEYIQTKIHADPNSIKTASLLGQKLKSLLEKNKDAESKNLIYEDMRASVKEVVEERTKEALENIDTSEEVGKQNAEMFTKGIADWNDANEHLIKRLEVTTQNASELRLALSEAVLPALGVEAVPLEKRTPSTPVPPLSNDSLLRILQSNQRATTVSPRGNSPRRKKCCCLGILLGL